MNIHERTKLTPRQREEIYRRHHTEHIRVALLAEEYHVSRPTIYKIPARGRKRDFSIHNSCNARFRTLAWGMKRLAKIEKTIEAGLKKEAKRHNKSYPGEILHLDSERLPLLKGQVHTAGEAERGIRTLMEMWHDKEHFESPEHRRKSLARFVNDYNWVKPHKSLGNLTPGEKLRLYFFNQDFVNNP